MKAELITIGDEILIGQIVDTNSQWMSKQLNNIGVDVCQISSIKDIQKDIILALKQASLRADIILITGGLGPTKDDITKKSLASYFDDDKVVYYPEVVEHIKTMFKEYDLPLLDVHYKQAEIPSKALKLFNAIGTAPGMWFDYKGTIYISMPGVPSEMKYLMLNEVLPKLQNHFELPFIEHQTINTFGQGESVVAERISGFEEALPSFVKLAYLPRYGKVRLRLSGMHTDQVLLKETINTLADELEEQLSDIVYGRGEQASVSGFVGNILAEKGLTIATAESMTGGAIASEIVSTPGASRYYKGSFIVYNAEMKSKLLGVSQELIGKYTVVSSQVARAMAVATKDKTNADIAISVTGNAGPSTDEGTYNVGEVYIGLAFKDNVEVFECHFGQSRTRVINKTIYKTFELILDILKD